MNEAGENCILLFVKLPAAGRVKTRLAQDIGRDAATGLYKSFVTDILTILHAISVNFSIVFYPPDAKKQFQRWLGKGHSYSPQTGNDLGQRMKNAILRAFSNGYKNVVLIGSDSPDLPSEYLELAFQALEKNDIVLGPTSDGGYYLIGFAKEAFLPDVFGEITWGSADVFEQTLNILKQHNKIVYLLPQWQDVDTLKDLKSLLRRNRNTTFQKSATISFLKSGELVGKFDV